MITEHHGWKCSRCIRLPERKSTTIEHLGLKASGWSRCRKEKVRLFNTLDGKPADGAAARKKSKII
jgi:hypothetical protein